MCHQSSVFEVVLLCVAAAALVVKGASGHRVCNVADYGARGDNKTLDTTAFVKALEACGDVKDGGGEVVVPKGVYRLGALNVTQSNVILRIDPEATLSFAPSFSLFPRMPHLPSYPCDRDLCKNTRFNPCLLIFRASNVTVTGGGTLEGNGWWWWNMRHMGKLPAGRPRLLETMHSSDIVLSHLNLHNSPFWTTHIWASERVEVGHVTVYAPRDSPNTDGVDPDSSSDVWIHHVVVHNGDDGIAVKSGMNEAGLAFGRPVKNIVVEHSHFLVSNGLSIGSEISGGAENITFRHNKVGPFGNGAYIKTAPARGGYVKNVVYDDIEVDGASLLIKIETGYGGDDKPAPHMTDIDDITYRNLRGTVKHPGHLICTEKIPCKNLRFDQVVVANADGQSYKCNGTITGTQSQSSPKVNCI